jgi:hypothetical protein
MSETSDVVRLLTEIRDQQKQLIESQRVDSEHFREVQRRSLELQEQATERQVVNTSLYRRQILLGKIVLLMAAGFILWVAFGR